MNPDQDYVFPVAPQLDIPIVEATDTPRAAFERMRAHGRSAVLYQKHGNWRFVSAPDIVEAAALHVPTIEAIQNFENIASLHLAELREAPLAHAADDDEEDEITGRGPAYPGPGAPHGTPNPLARFIAKAEPAPARCYCTVDRKAVPNGVTGGNHGPHIGTVVCLP